MPLTDGDRLMVVSLGAPRLVTATGVTLPCARKELAVLIYLMRRPRQQATRDELAATFWGDRGDERARHSLRQSLHRLRPLVGHAIGVTVDRVRVANGKLELDATLFEREIADGDVGGAV